ncbi:MAG: sigma-70 family RNA polymerase sigma factor [Clostridia bacterium]|nr:sigma-70 family RNA polymerase sigma factor [Clostridia bacterium]
MEPDRIGFASDVLAAQRGDAAAEQRLVTNNLPLVTAIAKRFLNRGVEMDDLRQLGSIGLLKAIRRFDVSLNVCFSTYAVPLIAGEIKRFLRDDGMIKFSRSAKQLAAAVSAALQEETELCIDALADRLNVTREDLAVAAASATAVASLDEPLSEDGVSRFERVGTDTQEDTCVQKLSLDAAIRHLSQREQLLIRLRYREEKTQAEVGKILGVSQVQISRMEKKILSALRDRMQDQ